MTDPLLERWLRALVSTPGLTSLRLEEARHALLEDSRRAVGVVRRFEGALVDVGSGGGVPGIPLARSLPTHEFVLLEAQERKCAFLREHAPPNARVVRGRAEEQDVDWAGCAVAKALAPPPVAAEWCLPLVRPGGAVVLWVGPSAEESVVARVAERVGARLEESPPGFFVLRKVAATPDGFPRRPGVARKRPLA